MNSNIALFCWMVDLFHAVTSGKRVLSPMSTNNLASNSGKARRRRKGSIKRVIAAMMGSTSNYFCFLAGSSAARPSITCEFISNLAAAQKRWCNVMPPGPTERSWTVSEKLRMLSRKGKVKAAGRQNWAAGGMKTSSSRGAWSDVPSETRLKWSFFLAPTDCSTLKTRKSSTPIARATRLAITGLYLWPCTKTITV